MHQAILVVRTQNNRVLRYPVSNIQGAYFKESRQLCRDLFGASNLVSWQGRDVIVELVLIDELGGKHCVAHDAVAGMLLIQ